MRLDEVDEREERLLTVAIDPAAKRPGDLLGTLVVALAGNADLFPDQARRGDERRGRSPVEVVEVLEAAHQARLVAQPDLP